VLYGCILGTIFIVIPFTYFFLEEFGERTGVCRRIYSGCKYTIFLVMIVAIIFVIGLFVQGGSPPTENTDYQKWVEDVIDKENRTSPLALLSSMWETSPPLHFLNKYPLPTNTSGGEAVMNFAFACAGAIGLVTWLIYTVGSLFMLLLSFGLALLDFAVGIWLCVIPCWVHEGNKGSS